MTNMSQFSDEMDEINFVESSIIFDETEIRHTFKSARMRGVGGRGSENIVQPASPVVRTLGSSQQPKHSVQTVSPVVYTAGQT